MRPPAHPNSGALPDLSHLPCYLPAIYHREFTRQQPRFSINCCFTRNSTTQCDCNSTGSPAHNPTFATNTLRQMCRKLNTDTFAVLLSLGKCFARFDILTAALLSIVAGYQERNWRQYFHIATSPGVQLPCGTDLKNEAERGHIRLEQSCGLRKYRPRRFQAYLIAGILKRRSSLVRVFTVSYLRREEVFNTLLLKNKNVRTTSH